MGPPAFIFRGQPLRGDVQMTGSVHFFTTIRFYAQWRQRGITQSDAALLRVQSPVWTRLSEQAIIRFVT
jgi:hypothetical protein